jgi:hypothetical protein
MAMRAAFSSTMAWSAAKAAVSACRARHFPPQPQGPLGRTPRAKTVADERFLTRGDGAVLWLTEAVAAG